MVSEYGRVYTVQYTWVNEGQVGRNGVKSVHTLNTIFTPGLGTNPETKESNTNHESFFFFGFEYESRILFIFLDSNPSNPNPLHFLILNCKLFQFLIL